MLFDVIISTKKWPTICLIIQDIQDIQDIMTYCNLVTPIYWLVAKWMSRSSGSRSSCCDAGICGVIQLAQ